VSSVRFAAIFILFFSQDPCFEATFLLAHFHVQVIQMSTLSSAEFKVL
jgi:hypothetical protein